MQSLSKGLKDDLLKFRPFSMCKNQNRSGNFFNLTLGRYFFSFNAFFPNPISGYVPVLDSPTRWIEGHIELLKLLFPTIGLSSSLAAQP